MTEREAEDWLIRYLVVMVVGATAALAFIYGYVMADNLALVAVSLVALVAVSGVVAMDLRSWRQPESVDRRNGSERPGGS